MDYSNIRQPGRFIFRIDEWIQPGGCNDIDSDLNFELESALQILIEFQILNNAINFDYLEKLEIWPRSGNMLGGQEVNITGPCFGRKTNFLCKWGDGYDAPITVGEVTFYMTNASEIRGRCVQPTIYYNGRVNLSLSLDDGQTFKWKQEFNIGKP